MVCFTYKIENAKKYKVKAKITTRLIKKQNEFKSKHNKLYSQRSCKRHTSVNYINKYNAGILL
jgi:hypothetical protein